MMYVFMELDYENIFGQCPGQRCPHQHIPLSQTHFEESEREY